MRPGEFLTREAKIEPPARAGALPRSTLSTEDPQPTPFGIPLVLDHSAIDFERAAGPAGLPLLVNHSNGAPLPVGRIRNVRVEDDALRGDLTVSEATEMGRDVRALIDDGTLRDISIGFELLEEPRMIEPDPDKDEEFEPYLRSGRWRPLEGSVLGVARDPRAGIGRSALPPGGNKMEAAAPAAGNHVKAAPQLTAEQIRQAAVEEAGKIAIEGVAPDRADAARSLVAQLKLDRTVTAEDASSKLLEFVSGEAPTELGSHISGGEDGLDKFAQGAERALCIRSGLIDDDKEAGVNEFAGYSMLEMARVYATRSGLDVRGLGREDVIRRVMTRAVEGAAANTSLTYPLILENVMGKAVYTGFDRHPSTWSAWCSTGRADDFKEISRPGLSQFQDLDLVLENGEYLEGSFAEKTEKGSVGKYGRRYSLSMEAMVSDDLGAFRDKGPKMGESAARLVNSLVYGQLVANPTMTETGRGALFQTTGTPQVINAGTDAVSETAINAVRVAMIRKLDSNNVKVKPRLQYVIGPPELSQTVEKLLRDNQLPTAAGGTREHNTVANRYTWVEDAELTAATTWYGAAERGKTFEYIFLDGRQTPTVQREEGFKHDVMWLKVRIVVLCLALDWRGLWRNVGA